MKVYKCVISDDEMFTDSVPFEDKGGFFVLQGKYVTRKKDDVDASAIGGNPSAEEAEEGTEGGSDSGVNIVLDSRLKETGFGTKKEYQVYMKDYMKSLFAKLAETKSEEDLKTAKAEAAEAFKVACSKFKDWQFFTGEGMTGEGLIALMEWADVEEDGKTVNVPIMYFYKAGIIGVKY